MKRLDTTSLPSFIETAGVAVVFFGADDASSMTMAEEFAQLWADVVTSDLLGVRFGYVDSSVDRISRGQFGVSELPALLIVRNGEVTHRFEGFCSRKAVLATLRYQASAPALWWRAMACETGSGKVSANAREAQLEAA
jgi:hypothetical protein